MRKRCGAKTKSGETCHAWAMPNGLCRKHGGEFTSSQLLPEIEKKTQNGCSTAQLSLLFE
jgi:hypothetical protein